MEDRDLAVALQLQEKFNLEASSKDLNKKRSGENTLVKSSQGSLIDGTWEYVDPTPDVYGMFHSFNNRFFWGKLSGVEVKWSSRMTTCAGVCSYESRGGLCSVRLSAPLLKLRPRKDLVETLLHEMIHAYLFVTHNNRDRDGHGPEFHKHMNRINKEAGTKITVYHSFHEEVRFYQQHWWRCDGPCQNRPPFFGTVRRASNRAPGPNDFWWGNHRATCGGTFIKIKEPEGFKSKDGATTKGGTSGKSNNIRDIRSFFPTHSGGAALKDKNHNHSGKSSSASGIRNNVVGFKDFNEKQSKAVVNKSQANGGGEMGRISKKVGGFGGMLANKGGGTLVMTTKDKKPTVPAVPSSSKNDFVPFHGQGHTLGSSSASKKLNRNVYVDTKKGASENCTKVSAATKRTLVADKNKVSPPKKAKDKSSGNLDCKPSQTNQKSQLKAASDLGGGEPSVNVIEILDSPEKNSNVQCPVCSKAVNMLEINSHLDACVESAPSDNLSSVHCPVCNEELVEAELNQHLETCVKCLFVDDDDDEDEPSESGTSSSGGDISDKLYPCPCCMTWVKPELMNRHLDECLSSKLLSEVYDVDSC